MFGPRSSRLIHKLLHPASYELPNRLLLLITSPRSGSTWLFDALRSHPQINMIPSAEIYHRFALKGRRYPIDLSKRSDAEVDVEVKIGKWESVPGFGIGSSVHQGVFSPVAIEKIHPQFYEFDAAGFARRAHKLKRRVDLFPVYHVREPLSSLVSFLNYKNRNPAWYRTLSQDQVVDYMTSTYRSLVECQRLLPGPVHDYAQMRADVCAQLMDIYSYIWPGSEQDSRAEVLKDLAVAAGKSTDREKRAKDSTPFLAKHSGPTHGSDGQYEELFTRRADLIAEAREAYQRLQEAGAVFGG